MADPKWAQGEIERGENRDFKIEDSKWADGKHEFNRRGREGLGEMKHTNEIKC